MQIGDVVNMTHWTHFQPNIQASYRAPKGRVGVFLLLGDADKKAPESFDAAGAIRALGWVPGTETDEADDLLAVTSLEAGEKIATLERQLREARKLIDHISGDYTGDTYRRMATFLSDTEKPGDAP